MKESIYRKELKRIETNFRKLFHKLYANSNDFKKAVDSLRPSVINGLLSVIPSAMDGGPSMYYLDELLLNPKPRKLPHMSVSFYLSRDFLLIVNLYKKLIFDFNMHVNIVKFGPDGNPKGKIQILFWGPRQAIASLYKVKGQTIKQIKAQYDPSRDDAMMLSKDMKRVDEIEIQDLNSLPFKSGNALTDGFGRMSAITPTVVKYINRNGDKKLLVSIPEKLDFTAFKEEYGKVLWTIHHGFFSRKTSKGRPRSKDRMAALILEILEKRLGPKRKEGFVRPFG